MKKTLVKILLIFITSIIFLTLFLLFENNYEKIIQILDSDIESILRHNPFMVFILFFGIFGLFNICFLPGKTLFVTISGFLINNFLYSCILIFTCEILWIFISYPVLTYLRKYSEFILKLIDKNIHEILKKKCYESPWKTCFLIQSLGIPQTFRNVLLISFDVNFYLYFITYLSVNLIYISLLVIMAMSLKSLKNLCDSKENKKNIKIYLISTSIGLFSIFLYIFIFCYIKREYNKIIKEKKNNKNISTNNKKDQKISINMKSEKKKNLLSEIETEDSETSLGEIIIFERNEADY